MEIERKWLVKELPDLNRLPKESFERYFLFNDNKTEIRIQKRGEVYEFERKCEINALTRSDITFEISAEEFTHLKKYSGSRLIRDSYLFHDDPEITIKIYHGDYEGLIRVEVEFATEQEAKDFVPFSWFGKEITETMLGRDKKLVTLTPERFKETLKQLA